MFRSCGKWISRFWLLTAEAQDCQIKNLASRQRNSDIEAPETRLSDQERMKMRERRALGDSGQLQKMLASPLPTRRRTRI